MPTIEGRNAVLHYTHPLSHIDSVQEVVEEGMRYMRGLSPTVLAGMYISILRYVGALKTKEDAAFINSQLCKAGKGTLLHATKALSSYTVPLATVNKKLGMIKVAFDGPFETKHDANMWIASVTGTLLEECLDCGDIDQYAQGLMSVSLNTAYVSPMAFANQADLARAAEARAKVCERKAIDDMA
jgi:hypothetical protein